MGFLDVLEAEAERVAAGTAEACAAAHFELADVACERIADHLHTAEMMRDLHAGHINDAWTTWPV